MQIAMDKMSARSRDLNGHLLVDKTIITKAAVNGYIGSSIPNWQELGLDANREYKMLRCPEELRASLPTFKGLQLLMRHIPVASTSPEKESTIGSIGTEITMDEDGRVWSSLRVFDQDGIDYIESGELQELSAGYAYEADMSPGTWNGEQYDGIMRNIHGNHVAIVNRGRIGSDAIIADSLEGQLMAKKIKVENGGLAKLQQQLGMDSAELKKVILAVHGSTIALDEDDKKSEDEDDKKSDAEDGDDLEIVEDSDDDKKAEDEDEGEKAKAERKKLEETDRDDRDAKKEIAQDAAMIEQRAVARVTALFEAKDAVRSIVGEIACDSAEDAYSTALKQMGHDIKGVHPSAYKAMFNIAKAQKAGGIAMDSAAKPQGKASADTVKLLERF